MAKRLLFMIPGKEALKMSGKQLYQLAQERLKATSQDDSPKAKSGKWEPVKSILAQAEQEHLAQFKKKK